MLPDPKRQTTETQEAPQNGDLLAEITQKTVDLADTLGRRWGIEEKKNVRSFARSFISSKSEFGWEVVHQFMTVCSELDLNPARKEVAAFYSPDKGLTTFVMIDGWLTLANRNPDYDGYRLHEVRNEKQDLVAVRCEIFRKGRGHPTEATVKMSEWRQGGGPQWNSKPEWMLNVKALKQSIRFAFGFAGITDDDEAVAMYHEPVAKQEPKGAQMSDLKAAAAPPADEHDRKKAPATVAASTGAETTVLPAPKPALKLEDAKPPAKPEPANSSEIPNSSPEPETSPLGNPLPEQTTEKAPPPEPKAEPTPASAPNGAVSGGTASPAKLALEPVTCGKDGNKAIRKRIEDMDAAEVKFAIIKNAKDMLITKAADKLEARKLIEAALVERGLELGMTEKDFATEDFQGEPQGAKQPPAAPSEPAKPAEAPKPAPEPAKPAGKAVDAKGAAAWITTTRKARKTALGVYAKLLGLDPTTLAALESGDAGTWAGVGNDTVKEMGRILGDPEAATLMGLLGRA